MNAPTVSSRMEESELRQKLQEALNLLAKIATTVGETPISETFGNSTTRAIVGHFIGIEKTLTDLADDEIPF